MSLSALLLGAQGVASGSEIKTSIDSELDQLFRSNASKDKTADKPEISLKKTSHDKKDTKRKPKSTAQAERVLKKARKSGTNDRKTETKADEPAHSEKDSALTPEEKPHAKAKGKRKETKKQPQAVSESSNEDEDSEVERRYSQNQARSQQPADDSKSADDNYDSESDAEGPTDLTHISLQSTKANKKNRGVGKIKYTPPDEMPAQRDARTIFVGNLSLEVAQKKPLQKKLKQHILSLVPDTRIESIRFRSVPFKKPTAQPSDAVDSNKNSDSKSKTDNSKSARTHDLERTFAWRKTQEDDNTKDEKKFLTPAEKKKIAFINHEFHTSADTVNSYIVFGHPIPESLYPKNVPPPKQVIDPYEAARLAVKAADGSMFVDRALRVDLATKDKDLRKVDGKDSLDGLANDPKLTVFVGNLDFESEEEGLRVFFEDVLKEESGVPPKTADKLGWVRKVRIVRDKDTLLGKGFAYVQFVDSSCVDEILSLEETKLKFAKRKLRVQRCKTLPGAIGSIASKPIPPPSKEAATATARAAPKPISIPKGNPSLGEKLADLSKEERKKVKAGDADRVARRLAKKKARNALKSEGVKAKGAKRERVRKNSPLKGEGKKRDGYKAKAGRVRSKRSLTKRNMKK